ncbi:MAG: T9SS type A sorting domain-containing protein [Bacteroidales bacterium]|nr:MAG: T9SS type A sorting domain-containing protein [Bacteroidales bacterium]
MKRLLFIGILFFLAGIVSGQMISHEVIASGGDYAENGDYYVSATIGEIVTETFNAYEHFLTQGFQQPVMVLESVNPVPAGIEISVYPNPVAGQLKVAISLPVQNGGAEVMREFMLNVENLTGNQVLSRQLVNLPLCENIEIIDFSSFSRGIYIVRIYSLDSDHSINLNFKIVKM